MVVASCQHHYRKVLVDQRIWTMLEFARRIAFSMSVGNFLELERSLARDCIMYAAPQVEKLFRAEMFLSELFREIVPGSQICLNGIRQAQQPLQVRARDLRGHASAFSSEE